MIIDPFAKIRELFLSFIHDLDEVAGPVVDAALGEVDRYIAEQFPQVPSASNQFSRLWAHSSLRLQSILATHPEVRKHRNWISLIDFIASTEPPATESEFPTVSEAVFDRFITNVPHLFQNAQEILEWAEKIKVIKDDIRLALTDAQKERLDAGCALLKTLLQTAAVTAPTDCWTLYQVISTHRRLGVTQLLSSTHFLTAEQIAKELKLNPEQLEIDLHFLHTRGYLEKTNRGYRLEPNGKFMNNILPLPEELMGDATQFLIPLMNGIASEDQLSKFNLWMEGFSKSTWSKNGEPAWVSTQDEIVTGYFIVPLILTLNTKKKEQEEQTKKKITIRAGELVDCGSLPEKTFLILERAGYAKYKSGQYYWTDLGARAMENGPGPFGIIHAYYPYMEKHRQLLTQISGEKPHVDRGPNIGSSEDAHRKSFQQMILSHAAYVRDHSKKPQIVIEHAVGKGAALKAFIEYWKANGWESVETDVKFFGFDYEQKALQSGAESERTAGRLPVSTILAQADIGQPEQMLEVLQKNGIGFENGKFSMEALRKLNIVMFVGAGLHEIRASDDRLVEILRQYQEMGILLIADETTELTASQLRKSAWQTYQAGFDYFHKTSGQNLRPAVDMEGLKLNWSDASKAAGFKPRPEYYWKTRPILPIKDKSLFTNPSHRLIYVLESQRTAALKGNAVGAGQAKAYGPHLGKAPTASVSAGQKRV